MHLIDLLLHVRELAGATGALTNLSAADALNAQIRMKEGNWGPTVIMMAVILAPFVWHEWLVVLDSCPFLFRIDWRWTIPLPELIHHKPGSWGVPLSVIVGSNTRCVVRHINWLLATPSSKGRETIRYMSAGVEGRRTRPHGGGRIGALLTIRVNRSLTEHSPLFKR
jgi:hypothetical protein